MANVRRIEPRKPLIPKRERVAAYARVSLEKDSMVHSLSAQISYYSDMIQKNPAWIYAGVYADEAFTGTKAERPEFQRMLEDCRAGKIDRIITKSISRFARNTVTMLETVRELKKRGIDVYFEKERIHSMSGDGELMLTILSAYAQEESRSVSDNMKWSVRKRFSRGKLVNLRYMYGYHITRAGITICEPEAEIVRRVFREYISGESGMDIARRLQAENIPAMHGGVWTTNKIDSMISNEKYSGCALLQKCYTPNHLDKLKKKNRGQLPKYSAEGTHPAIIDRNTYLQAREIMEANRIANKKANEPGNTCEFTGIIRCGICGKNYQSRTLHHRKMWVCATYKRYGVSGCRCKQIPDDILKGVIADLLGMPEYDAEQFTAQIREIRVPEANQLTFVFRDEHEETRSWRDRSRADSWTPEMRKKASADFKRRHLHE